MNVDRLVLDTTLQQTSSLHSASRTLHQLPPLRFPQQSTDATRFPPPPPQNNPIADRTLPGLSQWSRNGPFPQYQSPFPQYDGSDSTHGPGSKSPQPQETTSNDNKRPRACEACRGLKVRCETDRGQDDCKRCIKAGRSCHTTEPCRKRQKKTDSRIAELEKKIEALTATVGAAKGSIISSETTQQPQRETFSSGTSEGRGREQSPFNYISQRERAQPSTHPTNHKDVVDVDVRPANDRFSGTSFEEGRTVTEHQSASVLDTDAGAHSCRFDADVHITPKPNCSPTTAHLKPKGSSSSPVVMNSTEELQLPSQRTPEKLFVHYTQDMAPYMPFVVFDPDMQSDTVRHRTPFLWHAIICNAARYEDPPYHHSSKKILMQKIADSMFLPSEVVSLELIQAMQVMIIWQWPKPFQSSFHTTLVHMVCKLGLELHGSAQASIQAHNGTYPYTLTALPRHGTEQVPASLESARALIGCYVLNACMTTEENRLNPLLWVSRVEESLACLEKAQIVPSDLHLCQWVRHQQLADSARSDMFLRFPLKDVDQSSQNESVIASRLALAKEAMEVAESTLPGPIPESTSSGQSSPNTPSLEETQWVAKNISSKIRFHVLQLYTLEPVLNDIINVLPYRRPSSDEIKVFEGIIKSTSRILIYFCKFADENVRALPTVYFYRMLHAAFLIVRVCFLLYPDRDLYHRVLRSQKPDAVDLTGILLRLGEVETLLRRAASLYDPFIAKTYERLISKLIKWLREHLIEGQDNGEPTGRSAENMATERSPEPSDECPDKNAAFASSMSALVKRSKVLYAEYDALLDSFLEPDSENSG